MEDGGRARAGRGARQALQIHQHETIPEEEMTPDSGGHPRRFLCTPGGSIARGRWRLRWMLQGLAALMVGVAVATWISGRFWAGFIALAVAGLPWMAWRMSGDLDLLWLELDGDHLNVQMRRSRESLPVAGARGRLLTEEEVSHLEGLVTQGGIAAGTGGFDSHLLGEFDLYATDLRRAVLVKTPERALIVTPDDPQAFLRSLQASGG